MNSSLRLWWQKIRQHPVAIWMVIAGVVGIALIVVLALGYWLDWDWTGLGPYMPPTKDNNFQRGKTLWDWLQLLIIPVVLAVAGFWLNQIQKSREEEATDKRTIAEQEAAEKRAQTEREIASDYQREAALQAYIDKMSELLLEKRLRGSAEDDEVRKIARVRTLRVLPRLDKERKRSVLQFLHESGLIEKGKRIIDLSGADLSGANLSGADLGSARGADLGAANLSVANLGAARISTEQLDTAKSLEGAIMPDGSTHPY